METSSLYACSGLMILRLPFIFTIFVQGDSGDSVFLPFDKITFLWVQHIES